MSESELDWYEEGEPKAPRLEPKLTSAEQSRGHRARQRAALPVTSRHMNKRVLAQEVARMVELGMTNKAIAQSIQRSERYVRELKAFWREESQSLGFVPEEPKSLQTMSPEIRERYYPGGEYSLKGFRNFFNDFSGRELPKHSEEWVDRAITERRVLLNVPPRHAKSTILSVWLPMYLVCGNRNIQVLIISQTADFAAKFSHEIAEHFEHDEAMIRTFGYFRPDKDSGWPWKPSSGELMVAGRERQRLPGDRTIQIRGAKQQVLGMEADRVICDDPDSPDIVNSATERQRLREWFDQQVMTRLSPKGQAVVIGQRLHMNDLYGYLEKKHRTRSPKRDALWHRIVYPAVLQWPDEHTEAEVLWPDIWPFDELMEKYEELGYAGFETMYQQNPMPMGERIVKPEWIVGDDTHPGCLDEKRHIGEGVMLESLRQAPVARVLSVDPSPMRKTGLVIADVPYNAEVFRAVVVYNDSKVLTVGELKHEVERLLKMFATVDYFIFEDSAVSKWLIQDPWYFKLSERVRVISHRTHGHNKGDPHYGVQSLAIELEKGRIRFPYADADSRFMTDSLLNELYGFPQFDYDDQLMALWFIKVQHRYLYPVRAVTDTFDARGTAFDATGFDDAWDGFKEEPKQLRIRSGE